MSSSGVPAREQGGRPAGGAVGQQARQTKEQAKNAGRQASRSGTVKSLGRFGLLCRGVLYVLIGFLALQIAFGGGGEEADSSGALQAVAGTPFGTALLWLLALGFAGLALWQLSEAFFVDELKDRVASAARVVVYGVLCASTVRVVTGGSQSSGDAASRDFTARAMEHTGGRLLVGLIGLGVLALGGYFVARGVKRSFLEDVDLSGAGHRTRKLVELLGLAGNIARGVAFAAVGVFVTQAAVSYDPEKARGLDGSLRSFADTPLGPWLLALLALGLMLFGAFSCFQARFQRSKAATGR